MRKIKIIQYNLNNKNINLKKTTKERAIEPQKGEKSQLKGKRKKW